MTKREGSSDRLEGISFRAVEGDTWADFERLFESPGAPKYCWCMAWRAVGPERENRDSKSRKSYIRQRVAEGVPIGIVGYLEGEPIAWCSIAPRPTYRKLGGIEDPQENPEKVWSLVCFYAPRRLRGRGISRHLISAAVEHARRRGASVVEAYPVDPESPSYRFMGHVNSFLAAGWHAGDVHEGLRARPGSGGDGGAAAFGLNAWLASKAHCLAVVFLVWGSLAGLDMLLTSALRLWSSKVGKPRKRERLLDSLELRGDEIALDVGCGRGLLLNGAARRLPRGKAIDIDLWRSEDESDNRIGATLSNAESGGVRERVEVKTGDMRDLPLPDSSVDVVVSRLAIHNIGDVSGREQALREVARVLEAGGRVALLDLRCTEEYAHA